MPTVELRTVPSRHSTHESLPSGLDPPRPGTNLRIVVLASLTTEGSSASVDAETPPQPPPSTSHSRGRRQGARRHGTVCNSEHATAMARTRSTRLPLSHRQCPPHDHVRTHAHAHAHARTRTHTHAHARTRTTRVQRSHARAHAKTRTHDARQHSRSLSWTTSSTARRQLARPVLRCVDDGSTCTRAVHAIGGQWHVCGWWVWRFAVHLSQGLLSVAAGDWIAGSHSKGPDCGQPFRRLTRQDWLPPPPAPKTTTSTSQTWLGRCATFLPATSHTLVRLWWLHSTASWTTADTIGSRARPRAPATGRTAAGRSQTAVARISAMVVANRRRPISQDSGSAPRTSCPGPPAPAPNRASWTARRSRILWCLRHDADRRRA